MVKFRQMRQAPAGRRRSPARALAALTALGLMACGQARAAEQVTLTNGFALLCDHREIIGSRVRLYTGSASYIEVPATEIAGIEAAPASPSPAAPAPAKAAAAPSGTLTRAELRELVTNAGAQHNLDVDLLASVIRAESGGNARAVSRTGARGLMQLMPATASELGVADSFHPAQNVNGGTAYLDALLTRYHDNLALALAAYNAGPAAVDRYRGIPPYRETRAYVARVIHEFNRACRARDAAEPRRNPAPAANTASAVHAAALPKGQPGSQLQ